MAKPFEKVAEPRYELVLARLSKRERRLMQLALEWENEGRKKQRHRPLTNSDFIRALIMQRVKEVGVTEDMTTGEEKALQVRQARYDREKAVKKKRQEARPPYDNVVRTKSEMSFFAEWEAIIKGTHPELSPGVVEAAGIVGESTDEEEEAGDEEGTEDSDEGAEG